MSTHDEIVTILGEIDAEIAAVEERLETLRLERRGGEAMLRRLEVPRRSAASPSQPTPQVGGSGNAAIVTEILTAHPDGLHLTEIETEAAERGTPLDNEQVRGAVAYLKRVHRAERRGRGLWRLVPTDAETASEAPEAVSVLPDLSPEGGDTSSGTRVDDHRDDLQGRNGDQPTGASIVRG